MLFYFLEGGFHNVRPFLLCSLGAMDLIKKRTGVAQKLHELTTEIVKECGYVLYDDEYITGSSTLRVFIMDAATKTAVIEDCIKVDRAFSPHCETLEWIPNDFVLEVSSPGVYRSLKAKEHFESAVDDFIELTLNKNLEAPEGVTLSKGATKNKKIRARLLTVADNEIEIELEDQKIGVPFEQIKKANLDPDLHG